MRILVTGGAGFIGSHIVDTYINAGHDVIVVDDLSTGKRENLNSKARFVQADIQDPTVRQLIVQEKVEVLNHHAAQMDVRRSVADPLFDARINILGMLNLLEGAREAGVKKIIFASSGGTVYGEQETFPATEEHSTRPICPYGVSKRTGEHYLYFYNVEYRIPYIALRYANIYGPRQDPHGEAGVVAIFTLRLLAGEQPIINGDGKQTRDYVFVGDVARANLAALQTDYTGPINIGTGSETDVNQLFGYLRQLTGSPAPETHGPAKPGEQRRSVLAWGRAQQLLGWQPEMKIEEGLRRTVEYFRTRT
jgi:UDP-glucose 4-epimerase